MAVRLGFDAKLYYCPTLNPTGGASWNDPTPTTPFPTTNGAIPEDSANADQDMVELTNVKNLTFNMEKNLADITTRASSGWRIETPVLKTASVDFQMVWDSTEAGFANVSDVFFNNRYLYCAILDGDPEDTTVGLRIQGLYAPFGVSNFSRSEDLEEALMCNVTLSLDWISATYAPEWVDRTNPSP